MSSLPTDLKFTFRALGKSAGFTLIAVLTLAFGIGTSAAVFSIIDGVLLRPLALPEPEQLVALQESVPAFTPSPLPVNASHYVTWRARAASFADLALLDASTISLTGTDEPKRLSIAYVTGSLFPTLRVAPVLGRSFTEEEETAGHNTAVILSDGLWRRQFQADPGIIGRTIMLDQVAHTVVGVLPPSLRFPDLKPLGSTPPGFSGPDVFKPKIFPAVELAELFGRHNYTVIARLKPGITTTAAQRELNALAVDIAKTAGVDIELRAVVTPLQEIIVRDSRRSLLVLLGSVVAVLLIGSVNLASLLLARMEHRRNEAALRLAVGASRFQVLRLALLEPLVIAFLGGLAGLFIADSIIELFPRFAPADLPRIGEVRMDGSVFAFAVFVTAASALFTGLLPAWQLSRNEPGAVLAAGGRSLAGSGKTGRSHRLLLTIQIALSVVLLTSAGLLSRSLLQLALAEQGYREPGAITAEITAPTGDYRTDQQRIAFYDRLLERLSASPGTTSAAICSLLPLQGESWVDKIWVPGDGRTTEERPSVNTRFISQDYFSTIGLRFHSGRTFNDADRSRRVVVISRQLADILWPGQDPIGRSLARNPDDTFEVIGVVEDVRAQAGKIPVPTLYRQFSDWPMRNSFLVVKSDLSGPAAIASLRTTVRAVDPDVTLVSISTLASVADGAVAPQRFQTALAVSFAVTAALLTALGLFGVVSYSVACRHREFGVRLALGAAPGVLPFQVLRQYVSPVLLGLGAGLAVVFAAGHLLDGLLFETDARDPIILGLVALMVVAVSLASTWFPARRAAKVDPMIALRAE